MQVSDWVTRVSCVVSAVYLHTSDLLWQAAQANDSLFIVQDIVRGESYLLLRPDRVAMQDATAQVGTAGGVRPMSNGITLYCAVC